jgi:hypothetical protein
MENPKEPWEKVQDSVSLHIGTHPAYRIKTKTYCGTMSDNNTVFLHVSWTDATCKSCLHVVATEPRFKGLVSRDAIKRLKELGYG